MLLDKLDYVIAVAEEQNLTRAAERLFVSQPTLTLYLNRLESELGVKLFDRGKASVQLTEAGRYYLEQMKKVRAATQSIRQDLQTIADPAMTLRVGIGQVRGNHWLPIILPPFCTMHPQINVHIMQGTESRMAELLQADKMDVAFGALPPSVSHLEIIDLFQRPEPLRLVVHSQFGLIPPEVRGQYSIDRPYVIRPECLNGLPFIAPEVSNGVNNSLDSILTTNSIRPARTITTTKMITGLQLTARGLGFSLFMRLPPATTLSPIWKSLTFASWKKCRSIGPVWPHIAPTTSRNRSFRI